MPRHSFVLSALEGGRTLANFLWIAMAAWGQGGHRFPGSPLSPSVDAPGARRDGPQPLQDFPALRRFSVHEPWLADPAVRVQCMWSHVGCGGQRYEFFVVTNGHHRTLGILMREHELVYMRLHANFAFAAVDGTLWAGEIRDQPVRRVFTTGGIDPVRRSTWSVSVVQRQRHCELQITTGGLIPWVHDFRTLDDAMLYAEISVTELQHRHAEPVVEEPEAAGWLM